MQYIGRCKRCGGSLMREYDYGERDVCIACGRVVREEYTGTFLTKHKYMGPARGDQRMRRAIADGRRVAICRAVPTVLKGEG